MTGTVRIEDAQVVSALEAFARTTAQRRPMMQGIGRRLLTRVQLGFRQGADPWGKAWAPPVLRSGQPLRDTGRLRNSFTAQADNEQVTVGTNVCYAVVHQFGAHIRAGHPTGNNVCGYTPRGASFLTFKGPGGAFFRKKEVKIPRRAMLPITEAGQATLPDPWAEEVIAEIQAHLEAAIE